MYDIRFNTTFCTINPISTVDELNFYIQQTKQIPFCVQLQHKLLHALSENYSSYGSSSKNIASHEHVFNNALITDVIYQLGYRQEKKQYSSANKRLLHTISSPLLGFDKSHFDFKYSQAEFVTRLCQLLLSDNALHAKVHESLCQVAIKQVSEFISFYQHAHQPYVFIDTGFKRSTQPIFALALCERQRRIKLPKTLQLLASKEQHSIVSKLITQHYQYYKSQFYQSQHAGKLGIWGDIQQYVYFFNDSKANEQELVFKINADGKPIVVDNTSYQMSKAVLTL